MVIEESWGIPKELLEKIKESGCKESLSDNMLIFHDGDVECFTDEPEVFIALGDGEFLGEVGDLKHIVMSGEKIDFKLMDRVKIETSTGAHPNLKDYAAQDIINNYQNIVVLNGADGELFTFVTMNEMAEYLSTADLSEILHVFSNGVLKEIEKLIVLTIPLEHEEDFEVEFEDYEVTL